VAVAIYANDARVREHAGWSALVALTGAIGLLLGLELIAPPGVTLGVLVLVLVVVSSLLLDERRALAIVGLAVASRAVAAFLGDISGGLAAVECASFLVAAGVALAFRRSSKAERPSPQPQAQPVADAGKAAAARRAHNGSLTDREHEVLQMAMQGLTAAQVAERLFISKRTVETHLERAYAKLGVRSKRELIASAFDQARSGTSG
jgi:DNA-binding CsgD family transcriptional regulator